MIRCFNCGTENADDSKYCDNCGAIINIPQPTEPVESAPESTAEPIPAPVQPQQQYAAPKAAASQKNDSVCVAGFVTSIVSIFCCGFTSLIGLGLSIWGFLRVKKNGMKGSGLALAGIIISGIMVFVSIISYATGTINRLTGSGNSSNYDIEEEDIDEPEETTTTTTTEQTKPTTTETTEATTESSAEETTESSAALTGIRPEFQEAMDDYEAFYDEYIAFMRNYTSAEPTDALGMMADYSRLMSSMAEYNESIDRMSDEPMSTEEALLYDEVTARVTAKILAFEAETLAN